MLSPSIYGSLKMLLMLMKCVWPESNRFVRRILSEPTNLHPLLKGNIKITNGKPFYNFLFNSIDFVVLVVLQYRLRMWPKDVLMDIKLMI